jgi:hypothetical protein
VNVNVNASTGRFYEPVHEPEPVNEPEDVCEAEHGNVPGLAPRSPCSIFVDIFVHRLVLGLGLGLVDR